MKKRSVGVGRLPHSTSHGDDAGYGFDEDPATAMEEICPLHPQITTIPATL